mgnify:CR=1 FL=1
MTSRTQAPGTRAMQGRSLIGQLAVWRARVNGRRELCAMDARMLRDIGLTRADALREYGKLPWQD